MVFSDTYHLLIADFLFKKTQSSSDTFRLILSYVSFSHNCYSLIERKPKMRLISRKLTQSYNNIELYLVNKKFLVVLPWCWQVPNKKCFEALVTAMKKETNVIMRSYHETPSGFVYCYDRVLLREHHPVCLIFDGTELREFKSPLKNSLAFCSYNFVDQENQITGYGMTWYPNDACAWCSNNDLRVMARECGKDAKVPKYRFYPILHTNGDIVKEEADMLLKKAFFLHGGEYFMYMHRNRSYLYRRSLRNSTDISRLQITKVF
jgi:hypothetical protein